MKEQEQLKVKNLFDLTQTIAAELLESVEFPWEALPKLKEFIVRLGNTLSEDISGFNIFFIDAKTTS